MRIEECFPDDYVVVDVETSGLNPQRDRVLEVGWVKVRDRKPILPAVSWVLNPTSPERVFEVPPKITDLTGITTENIAEGVSPNLIFRRLQVICVAERIIAHNGVRFDRQFLNEECKRFGIETFNWDSFLDTAALFKGWRLGMLEMLKDMSFYDFANTVLETRAYGVYFSLAYCCEVLGVDVSDLGDAHRASVDVVMVHRVLEKLREVLIDE